MSTIDIIKIAFFIGGSVTIMLIVGEYTS